MNRIHTLKQHLKKLTSKRKQLDRKDPEYREKADDLDHQWQAIADLIARMS